MNDKIKQILLDILVDIASGIILTIAVCSFAVPAGFPMAGVSGLALILYRLFGLPMGTMTILINIPIAIACYKTLGLQFYVKSLKTVVITSVILDVLGPYCPVYQGDMMLAAICDGVLCGIGYAIVFMRSSSTGGFDFIMMTIRHYFPHLSIGKIALVLDAIVISAGGLLMDSVDAIIYGLLLVFIYSTVLDKVIYGINSGKLTMIITDYPEKMVTAVDEIAGRGSTILNGIGGYTGEEKQVVMCASSSKEMYAIRKKAHEVDEKAFVIIMDSNEVIGEGFRVPGNQNLV